VDVVETKLPHLTAEPIVESFSPFAPIEQLARTLFMKGRSAANEITIAVISKLNTAKKEEEVQLAGRLYSERTEQESELYIWANNPKTWSGVLDQISKNCTVVISEAIAMNENASRSTLRRLAHHVSPRVRAAITENARAPFEVLSLLCKDEHPDVRFKMAENPHVPRSLLTELTIDDNPYVAFRARSTLNRLDQDASHLSNLVDNNASCSPSLY